MKIFSNLSNRIKQKKVYPTEIIGLQGVTAGVGATHLTVALANVLCSKERYRVAVAELREDGQIANLLEDEWFVSEGCVGFVCSGVDYYPKVNIDQVRLLSGKGYDYLLVLYPPSDTGVSYGEVAHRRIVIGSLQPWNYREYQKFMRDIYIERDMPSWDLYGQFLTGKQKRKFEAEFHVPIRELPVIEDPFCLGKKDLEYLTSLLV